MMDDNLVYPQPPQHNQPPQEPPINNCRQPRTRSSVKALVEPYNEPEREMHKRLKTLSTHEPHGTAINFDEAISDKEATFHHKSSGTFVNIEHNPHVEEVPSTPRNEHTEHPTNKSLPKSLKEYSSPTSSGFANAIVYPNEHTNEVLHATDIWLVQNAYIFHGLRTENPIHHIKDFLKIIDTIYADGASQETSRLWFLPFSLQGKAKEWLDKLPSRSIFTWDQLVSKFCDKFFPPGRTATIRDKILRFRQGEGESIYDSLIRFKDLIRQAPHHGISLWLLVQIFYDNISRDEHRGIDFSAGGKFSNLSAEEWWNRIDEYVRDQDNTWDEPASVMGISATSHESPPTRENRMKKLQEKLAYLTRSQGTKRLVNPYLICDTCGGPYEVEECGDDATRVQVFLSSHDIYDDPSLLIFYQDDDFTP